MIHIFVLIRHTLVGRGHGASRYRKAGWQIIQPLTRPVGVPVPEHKFITQSVGMFQGPQVIPSGFGHPLGHGVVDVSWPHQFIVPASVSVVSGAKHLHCFSQHLVHMLVAKRCRRFVGVVANVEYIHGFHPMFHRVSLSLPRIGECCQQATHYQPTRHHEVSDVIQPCGSY